MHHISQKKNTHSHAQTLRSWIMHASSHEIFIISLCMHAYMYVCIL